ncbi:hypothetical protein ACO0LM_17870, partial [Undibacterium sp. Di26W]|uniref:hypothetical protein n=1 Tax=Undibacterium sp. Di26W TaxID=3413035 RepID=UPI003BF2E960
SSLIPASQREANYSKPSTHFASTLGKLFSGFFGGAALAGFVGVVRAAHPTMLLGLHAVKRKGATVHPTFAHCLIDYWQ